MGRKDKIQNRFKINGGLSARKIREYLPAMIITNMSTLLLVSVDGMVVGNLIGSGALSSVNIFSPVITFVGALTSLVALGIATCLSTSIGKNDHDGIRYAKASAKAVMIIAALFVAVVQIPLVYAFINSYNLSDELKTMTWQYAIGIMIAHPFGVISTVGVYQLQIVGKMKALAKLAVMEGAVNLVLDLLFVGLLKTGVSGAGYGTAGANIIRCTVTVIYLAKCTDIYKTGGMKPRNREVKEILTLGLPDFAYASLNAIQNYLMMKMLLDAFGDDAGTIKGVCFFCFSLTNVIINGLLGSARPVVGLMSGGKDTDGLRILMRQGIFCLVVSTTVMVSLIMITPSTFYSWHGVDQIPDGGILSLRIYASYFIIESVNALFRMYFANRKDTKFATSLSVIGNVSLPVLAFLLSLGCPAPYIWFSYLIKEVIVFVISILRYLKWIKVDRKNNNEKKGILSLSVKPSEAVEASRMIRRYADEMGCPPRLSYRVSWCMEEMVAYSADAKKNQESQNQIVINLSPTEVIFTILDTGRCIALDEDQDKQWRTTNNYEIIKRMSSSFDYQYILNLNYTVLHFTLPETKEA